MLLHHDFPDPPTKNHHRLFNIISAQYNQLDNRVLSVYPFFIPILSDPLTKDLEIDRLNEIRKLSKIAGDITLSLQKSNAKDSYWHDRCLRRINFTDEVAAKISDILLPSWTKLNRRSHTPPLGLVKLIRERSSRPIICKETTPYCIY